jgi:ankyrin repeat protein
MIRHLTFSLALAATLAALCAAALSPLQAQQPPGDRELRVYAGLHAAAAIGDIAEIEKLIKEGENPNLQDSNSRTPLIVAAYRKHHEAVRALLRLGANPNARDLQRFDILTIGAVNNDLELVKLALEGGTDPRAVAGNYDGTALISAAHLGHVEIVKALIAAKANLDHVNSMGWTALLMCVVLGNNSKEHIATVEALVKAGADVDIKDRGGNSALAHARARRYDEMIKIMEPATGRKTMLQRGKTL